MDEKALTELSRFVSYALRHEPWLYELELDDDGWVSVDALLDAVHSAGGTLANTTRTDLGDMIAAASKERHVLDGDRIRALYGHSTPKIISRVAARPPEWLYHGTSDQGWAQIQRVGLRPMGRQYVHLSVDLGTAKQVGGRKSSTPVILSVAAGRASDNGTPFFRGNDMVWLAHEVSKEYLSVTRPQPH